LTSFASIRLRNQQVIGSSPIAGSSFPKLNREIRTTNAVVCVLGSNWAARNTISDPMSGPEKPPLDQESIPCSKTVSALSESRNEREHVLSVPRAQDDEGTSSVIHASTTFK
jgi:hypothetical protein